MVTVSPGDLWQDETDAAAIDFRHSGLPGQTFYVWLFESVTAQEDAWSCYDPPLQWTFDGDRAGEYRTARAGRAGLELEWSVRAEGADDRLTISAAFTNRSSRTLHDLCCDACLQFRAAPDFRDSAGERCLVWVEGVPQPAISTRRTIWTESWSPTVQVYRIAGQAAPYARGVVPGMRKWSLAPQEVSSRLVAMADRWERRHVGLAWERSWGVAHNPSWPHHCIHAQPAVGTIEPGETATVTGRVYFVEGGVEELHARFEPDSRRDPAAAFCGSGPLTATSVGAVVGGARLLANADP
jgi:hypothetical protein